MASEAARVAANTIMHEPAPHNEDLVQLVAGQVLLDAGGERVSVARTYDVTGDSVVYTSADQSLDERWLLTVPRQAAERLGEPEILELRVRREP